MLRIILTIALACCAPVYGAPIPPGPVGSFVNNSAAPQTAQFNVSSGTVRGKLTAGELAVTTLSVTGVIDGSFEGSGAGLTGIPWSGVIKTGSNLNEITTRDHSVLTSTGSNSHAAIDSHILSSAAVHGSTALNLGSRIVQRDASGNFAAGAITGSSFVGPVLGNATTATTAANIAGGSLGTIPYQTASGATAMLPAGPFNYVLQGKGAATPTWTSSPTITGANITAIPLSALSAGTLPVSIPASSITVTGTQVGTFGGPTQSAQITVGSDGRVRSIVQYPIPAVSTNAVLNTESYTWDKYQNFLSSISVGSIYGDGTNLTGVNDVVARAGVAALDVATTTLTQDLATEISDRQIADAAIGVTTGTLRTDLTTETNNRITGDYNLGVDTTTLYNTKVAKAGDTMTGQLTMNGSSVAFINGSIENVNKVQLNTAFTDGCNEGSIQWNADDGTAEICMKSGTIQLQIGQELLFKAKMIGTSGLNGQVVAITGASGQRPEIELADADAVNVRLQDCVIGVLTEDAGINQQAFFNSFGYVRDIDTSSFTDGDKVYLGTTAGSFVNVIPAVPAKVVPVGIVVYSHATEGVLFVNIMNVPSQIVVSSVTTTELYAGTATFSGPVAFNNPVTGISLSEIEDLTANKTFTMGNKTLEWQFVNPTGGMKWEFTGAAAGHSLEIMQTGGNPSTDMHLLHIHAEDADPTALHLVPGSAASRALMVHSNGDTLTNPGRFEMTAAGGMSWGTGAGATDTTLARTGIAALQTNSAFTAASFIGPLTGAASSNVLKAGDTMTGQLTTSSSMTAAGGFVGNLVGNANTASALAADPSDCTLPNVALGINASGAAQCSQPSNVSGTAANITGNLAASQVAAGSLGSGVIASSIAVNAVQDASIVAVSGSKVSGNISGQAGSVANGVYTTGSYANPAWITSLSTSKIDLSTVTTALNGKENADATIVKEADLTANDFNVAAGVVSLDYTNGQSASAANKGFLTSTDWSTFNNKQAAGNYITALTGDVTASGPGSVAATVVDDSHAHSASTLSGVVQSTATGTYPHSISGNAATATTATNFSGSLAGDVTGTQGATVVGNDSHTHSATTLSGVIQSTATGTYGISITGNATTATTTTGNAATATKLLNARTINGVSFDGTANINIATTSYLADGVSLALTGATFSAKSSSVTLQGNTFNGANQLLQLDGSGRLPAVDGSQLTNFPATPGGAVLASTQTFTGANTFESSTTFTGPVIGISNSSSTWLNTTAYTTTQTTFVNCITGSTLTLTTNGGSVLVGFSASAATGVETFGAALMVDGSVSMMGQTTTRGLVRATSASSGMYFPIAYTTMVTGLSAGSHTFCPVVKTNSGTLTLDKTTSSPQFWVQELR